MLKSGVALSVIQRLADGETLEPQYKDRLLAGDYAGFRECHIASDWLLVYRIEKNALELLLFRTGTHSDLF